MLTKKLTYFLLAVVAFATLMFFACTKTGFEKIERPKQFNEAKFFQGSNNQTSTKRIADDLREQNKLTGFLNRLANKYGYPVWNKAEIKTSSNYASRNTSASGDTILYIPLVKENTNIVYSYIHAKLDGNVHIRLYSAANYENYPKGAIESDNLTAEKVILTQMLLHKKMYGDSIFILKNNSFFELENPTFGKNVTQTKMVLKSLDGSLQGRGIEIHEEQVCWSNRIVDCKTTNHPDCSGDDGCDGYREECRYCVRYETECIRVTVISDDWDDEDYNGGGGGVIGGENGGGGGGTPNNPNNPDTPPGDDENGDNNNDDVENCISNDVRMGQMPCGGGDLVYDLDEQPDANGYYPSRKARLKEILEDNPFAMIPCDSINLLPILNYGSMFQNVAQHSASTTVIQRLDSIRNKYSGWMFFDDFNIQNLVDADGALVNCDFFPLVINQFPNNANGNPMSASEFLEYFRLNINQFISSPVSVEFSSQIGVDFNDSVKWNLPYYQAVGGMQSIHIPGPVGTSNDGSIILSEYKNFIGNIQHHYFRFSTLETPYDMEHPVAGTREFGIYNSTANPNQFTFYTMGVDRAWDIPSMIANGLANGFERGDDLWRNVQFNIIQYLNFHNPNTSYPYFGQMSINARPKWNAAKDFLLGLISEQEFRLKIGC